LVAVWPSECAFCAVFLPPPSTSTVHFLFLKINLSTNELAQIDAEFCDKSTPTQNTNTSRNTIHAQGQLAHALPTHDNLLFLFLPFLHVTVTRIPSTTFLPQRFFRFPSCPGRFHGFHFSFLTMHVNPDRIVHHALHASCHLLFRYSFVHVGHVQLPVFQGHLPCW
jgi:hypothetical protein